MLTMGTVVILVVWAGLMEERSKFCGEAREHGLPPLSAGALARTDVVCLLEEAGEFVVVHCVS